MTWSTPQVMDETRRRLQQAGLTWQEPVTLWDVDLPEDLIRLRACGMDGLLSVIRHSREPDQRQPGDDQHRRDALGSSAMAP